ncbi:MAG TPA: hypothetical protein VFK45_03160 [Gammaproteobacteria bacterium]|nr:hypothetical protein [Gammaproteobacteria bacterium]
MTEIDGARLDTAARTCVRHAERMQSAIDSLRAVMPMGGPELQQLTDEDVRALDQFVYRFGKLQDAAGTQLFPALLAALEEPYREWSVRDRLNRLEQLGILSALDDWEAIRAIRNRLTHEYPDDAERQAAILDEAWTLAPVLFRIIHMVIAGAEQRLARRLPNITFV